ncbi:MAG: glycosyltransferase [bacterium]|nr:glycosyltransferase [bacterium]
MENRNIKISVVIPTYNRKNLVLEAIHSALAQAPKNYEVIVVDDGSTDGTVKYLQSLKLPIKIISQENKGVSSARNTGIKVTQGEYMAFLDSDDLWLSGILKSQLEFLEFHPEIPLVYTDQFIESEGKRYEKTRFNSEPTTPEQKRKFDKPGFITLQAPIHISAVMIRKSIFDEIGFFNEDLQIHEDTDMWNRISEKYELGFIDKSLSVFRWEKDQEHLLKADARELFFDEARKYMKLYEERRKQKGLTKQDIKEICLSYKRIDLWANLVSLLKRNQITEEEFHQKRKEIFSDNNY